MSRLHLIQNLWMGLVFKLVFMDFFMEKELGFLSLGISALSLMCA